MSGIRDYSTSDVEQELRMEQMRADIGLTRVQASTEWPRFWIASVIAVAAIVGTVLGTAGFILGQNFHH